MLYFDGIGFSGEIDVNKTRASKECDICHYWDFLDYIFKFQPSCKMWSRIIAKISLKLRYV